MKFLLLWGSSLLGVIFSAHAEVRIPAILNSGMVLQQGQEVPVWGWADPGEAIAVTFAEQTQKAVASPDGKWRVNLTALSASKEGRPLTISGQNTIRLDDVLVGEVWVCSGQSNMEMALRSAQGGRAAVQQANDSQLRLFKVDLQAAFQPQNDCLGKWTAATSESVELFSAVAYFFGQELRQTLDVPVGLIHCAWGGKGIEAFIPRSALSSDVPWSRSLAAKVDHGVKNDNPESAQKKYEESLMKWEQALAAFQQAKQAGTANGQAPRKPAPPNLIAGPCRIFNGMIAPLIPFGIRGAIWYQGEANRNDGLLYTDKMKTLIAGWRNAWGQGPFPFYYVQLAPCKYAGDRPRGDAPVTPPSADIRPSQKFPFIWQAQLEALRIPQTGMAVTVDLDGPALHPARKMEVGQRLAAWALAKIHGKTDRVYSGPLFQSAERQGTSLRVKFDHAGSQLASRDGSALNWFEVAGEDKVYYPATAKIEGAELLVSSESVKAPMYVRYGWDEIAQPNLMNEAGLPASPFTSESIN